MDPKEEISPHASRGGLFKQEVKKQTGKCAERTVTWGSAAAASIFSSYVLVKLVNTIFRSCEQQYEDSGLEAGEIVVINQAEYDECYHQYKTCAILAVLISIFVGMGVWNRVNSCISRIKKHAD